MPPREAKDLLILLLKNLLPPANEVWGKVMFSYVFVWRWGAWFPSMHHMLGGGSVSRGSASRRFHVQSGLHSGILHPGRLHPGRSALGVVCIQGVCLKGVGRPPPPNTWDTTRYGQQAGGTHPTVMLSCFYNSFYINDTLIHMRHFCANGFHLFYSGEFTSLMLIQTFQCMFQILLNIHNDNLNNNLYFVSKTIPGRQV